MDERLAASLRDVIALETMARSVWSDTTAEKATREAALSVVRYVTATRRALEAWIASRAVAELTV